MSNVLCCLSRKAKGVPIDYKDSAAIDGPIFPKNDLWEKRKFQLLEWCFDFRNLIAEGIYIDWESVI